MELSPPGFKYGEADALRVKVKPFLSSLRSAMIWPLLPFLPLYQ